MKKVRMETGRRRQSTKLEAEVESPSAALAAAGLDISDALPATAEEHRATHLAQTGAVPAAVGHAQDLAALRAKLADAAALNAQLQILNDELRANEERLDAVVQSATDNAIIEMDFDGRITGWSPGAERLFGWMAAEAIGQRGAMIWTPEDRAAGTAPVWARCEALCSAAVADRASLRPKPAASSSAFTLWTSAPSIVDRWRRPVFFRIFSITAEFPRLRRCLVIEGGRWPVMSAQACHVNRVYT